MSLMIREEEFPKLVALYNNHGKQAAYKVIRKKYGVKNPWYTFGRIRNCGMFSYNEKEDCYEALEAPEESLFMSIEELCGESTELSEEQTVTRNTTRKSGMESLIQTLISDRLLELSRYVSIDVENRTITIDQTGIKSDGYKIIIC